MTAVPEQASLSAQCLDFAAQKKLVDIKILKRRVLLFRNTMGEIRSMSAGRLNSLLYFWAIMCVLTRRVSEMLAAKGNKLQCVITHFEGLNFEQFHKKN